VQNKLLPIIKNLYNNYKLPIVVTGHSLGGALAIFCAADLIQNNFKVSKMINYGEPRVGDANFATYFKSLSIGTKNRVVNQKDIVPHLPAQIMGFHHIPTEIWMTSAKNFRVCDNSGEDPTCSNSEAFELNIPDHTSYLGQNLEDGNPYGC